VGLWCDNSGHLYVADNISSVVRQIDLNSGVITTVAGNGTLGFSGDGGPASAASFFYVSAMTTDPSGNLFVIDNWNTRVRRILLNPTKLNAAVTASAGTANPGDSLTFTATYNGLSFGIAPTGTVTFLSGSTTLGTANLAPATDGSGNYIATLTTTAAPGGTTSITAQYSGDAHYAALTSNVAVTVGGTPSYTLSADPPSLTVGQGGGGSVTFTVTPTNGFNQAITFACDSTSLPTGVSCTFLPSSVTPSGSPVTTSLEIQTSPATISTSSIPGHASPLPAWWLTGGGSALALLAFAGLSRRNRRFWQNWMAAAMLALFLGGTTLGCSAIEKAINGGGSTQPNPNATPVGTYSLKVAATAGSGGSATNQPLTVTLVVTQ
jgi:hypothetical protein